MTVVDARKPPSDKKGPTIGPLAPLRPRLSEAVVGGIAADIISGKVPPGAMLPPEPRLCARFGVSRTVVREAVARLQRNGLVQVRQGLGTIVLDRSHWNDLDPELLRIRAATGLIGDLVDDLLAIRRLVEVEVAGQAALRRTDDDLARLAELLEGMAATMDDPVAYTDGDVAYHEALIAAGRNELLRQMMRPVHQIRRIGSVITTSRDPALIALSMAAHRAIYDAVAAGDTTAARTAMAAHVAQFERDISEAVTTASPQHIEALAAAARAPTRNTRSPIG